MAKLDFSVIIERWPEILHGTLGTLMLAVLGMALSLVIGVTGVALRRTGHRAATTLVVAFVEITRNTPFLVQIFFIFFVLPLGGIRLNPTFTAIAALGINGGAFAIEIIRGGIESIHKGQIEAGFALGLHRGAIFRIILLKPALRAIYPALCSQFIMLTLTTSICTSISAYELTHVVQMIDGDTFRSFEAYFTATAIYLLLSWLIMTALGAIGRLAFRYPVG